jgi:Tol biopolymer transport system component
LTLAIRIFALAIIPTVCLTGCSDSTGADFFGNRPILFTGAPALRPGTHDIYIVNPDGSGLVKMTAGVWDAGFPRWSPDGREFAFIWSRNGPRDIWIMQADQTGVRPREIPNPDRCSEFTRLSWSPTGDRILGDCEMVEQFVITLSDSSDYSLTQAWGNVADFPDWSPSRDEILYLRGPDIWSANLDGSAPKIVATQAMEAAWSPDGRRIAFGRLNENQAETIWVANADGTNPHQVTFPANGTIADAAPAWSPDGTRLVFWRTETENPRGIAYLGVVSADGGPVKRITPDTLLATRPDW